MTKARTLADNYAADINQITADAPLTGGGTSGTVTVGIQAGTTAQSGAVQLTDSTASTSTTTAATPNSVKSAYDLANGAIAKSLVDAKADLITATANDTPARLAVGTDGQVLTAASTTSTGLQWATPSSGALTKITDGSFSNQATVDVDNIFSTTYLTYMAIIQVSAVTADNDFQLQFRYAGPNTQESAYYTSGFQYDRGNTLTTYGSTASGANAAAVLDGCGAGGDPSYLTIYFREVGNSSGDNPVYWGSAHSRLQSIANFAGYNDTQRLYTGIRLKSSSSNISGNYRIYGLAN